MRVCGDKITRVVIYRVRISPNDGWSDEVFWRLLWKDERGWWTRDLLGPEWANEAIEDTVHYFNGLVKAEDVFVSLPKP